jgi:hypothetical protein
VENPRLVQTLQQYLATPSTDALRDMQAELNSANYLVPILTDEIVRKPSGHPGQYTWEKGSLLKMLHAMDDKGAPHLPLFTDWSSIRAFTTKPISALVMPARDAWDFVLANAHLNGAMINPSSSGTMLTRSQIQKLR